MTANSGTYPNGSLVIGKHGQCAALDLILTISDRHLSQCISAFKNVQSPFLLVAQTPGSREKKLSEYCENKIE